MSSYWHVPSRPPTNPRTVLAYRGAGGLNTAFYAFGRWNYSGGNPMLSDPLMWRDLTDIIKEVEG